jgi:spore germination protein KB
MSNKEIISDKQGINMIALFIVGSAVILPIGAEVGKDLWLAVIISIAAAVPIVLIYAKILSLYPGKGLFDIFDLAFGKFVGKVMTILYTWFALHLGALVLRNFSEFMNSLGLNETPSEVLVLILIVLCIWVVKEGIEVLGRFSEFFLLFLIGLVVITALLLIPEMSINNIRPMLFKGMKPVMMGAFSLLTFPFTEIVVFSMVFSCLKDKKSAYKVYTKGLLIGGAIIFTIALVDMLVLGADVYGSLYFPTYTTVSRLNIGNFLQRLEIIVSVDLIIGGFVKISICLLSASKGITKLFGIKDYRGIVTPIGLSIAVLCIIIYDNIVEMNYWIKVWTYYAIVFEVFIPVIILVFIQIKVGMKKKKKKK